MEANPIRIATRALLEVAFSFAWSLPTPGEDRSKRASIVGERDQSRG